MNTRAAAADINLETGTEAGRSGALPYRVVGHRKNWLIWFSFFNFDGCILPIVLFYALWFGSGLSKWSVLAFTTSLSFWTSYHKWFSRGYRLLVKRDPKYRPIDGYRWAFDCSYYVLTLALGVMILEIVIATSTKNVQVKLISMAPPSTLYIIMLYMLLQNTMHCLGARAPCTLSSTRRGEPVPPPLFTVMEDVFAVDGCHMGLPARQQMVSLYQNSPQLRRTLMWWSWIWALATGVVAIALSIVVALTPDTVSFGIAYGVCWPFIALMAGITAHYMDRRDASGTFSPLKSQMIGMDRPVGPTA